jgi:antitoxin ChpS
MLQKSNKKIFKQKLLSFRLTLIDDDFMISPITKPKYQLEDLLAKCDRKAKMPKEDKEWLELIPIGNEIL